jgi:uncharacterized protein (DUF1778 family)
MARPVNTSTGRYNLAADPEQIATWQAAAEADGRTLASWIRVVLDRAAKKATRGEKKSA